MALGDLENKILKLVNTKSINIEKVKELFKCGADPNALGYDEPDKGFNEDIYYSTFFSECIFETQGKAPDLYDLLKVFIEYGLDIEKYGAYIGATSVLKDFVAEKVKEIYKEQNYLIFCNRKK